LDNTGKDLRPYSYSGLELVIPLYWLNIIEAEIGTSISKEWGIKIGIGGGYTYLKGERWNYHDWKIYLLQIHFVEVFYRNKIILKEALLYGKSYNGFTGHYGNGMGWKIT